MSHTVTIPHPIDVVWPKLSSPEHIDTLQQLASSHPVNTTLTATDHIQASPDSYLLRPFHPDLSQGPLFAPAVDPSTPSSVQRSSFTFTETFDLHPIPFSTLAVPLPTAHIQAAQIAFQEEKMVVFQSKVVGKELLHIKRRRLESTEEGGTKVEEVIWTEVRPAVLGWFLDKTGTAQKIASAHMERYHELF